MKFETINNQLCRMVEPEPIFGSTKAPFVIVGKNTKHPTIITQDMDILLRIFLVAYSDEFEIIGYPVEEGSHWWALWQMQNGKAVRNTATGFKFVLRNDLICHVCGEKTGFTYTVDDWLNGAAKSGWQLYEPEPLLADAKVGDLCKRRDGRYCQITDVIDGFPKLWKTANLEFHTSDGAYYNICTNADNTSPIIATEPLAAEGSAEWALQMMKLGKTISRTDNRKETYIYRDGKIVANEWHRADQQWFLKYAEPTGWQLYTEPEPEPEHPAINGYNRYDYIPVEGIRQPKPEPEIVAHKQHANCLVCGKVIEGLLDGHATVSIKRYSISSLYESTYSHYCGKCFLELGFDATERELRNRQQPIAEPEPAFKAGDWVEFRDIEGIKHGIIEGRREEYSVLCNGISQSVGDKFITRKLSPSEVVLDFGSGIKGRIRNVDDGWIRIRDNESLNNIATIDTAKLTEPMQTTVRKLLAAIEDERKNNERKNAYLPTNDGGRMQDVNIVKPPICPLCGSYTHDRALGGTYCVCGWCIDKNGDEDYDPDDLESCYDDAAQEEEK